MSSFWSWPPVFCNGHLALGKTTALTLVVFDLYIENVLMQAGKWKSLQSATYEKTTKNSWAVWPPRRRGLDHHKPQAGQTYSVISRFRSPKKTRLLATFWGPHAASSEMMAWALWWLHERPRRCHLCHLRSHLKWRFLKVKNYNPWSQPPFKMQMA